MDLDFYRIAYDELPVGVLIIDPAREGLIIYCNRDGADVIGAPSVAEAIGDHHWRRFGGCVAGWERDCERALAGTPIRDTHGCGGRWYVRTLDARAGGLVLIGVRDVTSDIQHRAARLLAGIAATAPRLVDVPPSFAAMLADGASIAAICAAHRMRPDAVLAALAMLAGLPLHPH